MFEEKSPFLGIVLTLLAVVGVIATVFSCVIAFLALVNPQQTQVILTSLAAVSTPTPVVIVITPAPAAAPPTYTPFPTYTPYPTLTPYPTPTAATTPTETAVPTPLMALPFADTFDNGPRAEWRPISGDWRMVDSQYTVTGSYMRWAYTLVGDPQWRDYLVEVDYSLYDSYANVEVLVRADGSSGLGLAFAVRQGLEWRISEDDDWSVLAARDAWPTSGHIAVEVRGNHFTGSVNGLNQLTVTDDSTSQGRVGLGVWCRSDANCPAFDNVRVTMIED